MGHDKCTTAYKFIELFIYITYYLFIYLFIHVMGHRETLSLAAELRLGASQGSSHSKQVVDDILKRLGLTASADTVVGDAKTRGLSGGEKKRLSIACELIGSPLLLFADEPTTGLDSFQAEKVG